MRLAKGPVWASWLWLQPPGRLGLVRPTRQLCDSGRRRRRRLCVLLASEARFQSDALARWQDVIGSYNEMLATIIIVITT